MVRSILTYTKLRPRLPSLLFYESRLRYIVNQSESTRETVSPNTSENIEMVVFFSMGIQDRFLIDIVIIHYYLFFILS